jgi:hypothetical protein
MLADQVRDERSGSMKHSLQPQVVAECKANLAEAEVQAELARKRLADLG